MWRDDAKATRANVEKRLAAAEEALNSAEKMLKRMGPLDQKAATSCSNAADWIGHCRLRLQASKGRKAR